MLLPQRYWKLASLRLGSVFRGSPGFVDPLRDESNTGDFTLDTLNTNGCGCFDRRASLEFDLSNLPSNAIITSASLELSISSFDTDYRSPTVSLWSYLGDGVINNSDISASLDFIETQTLCLGASGCTNTSNYSFDVSTALQTSLDNDYDYLGFRTIPEGAVSLRWRGDNGIYPELVVEYSLPSPPPAPKPGSLNIAGLLVLAGLLLLRLRKNAIKHHKTL